METENACAQSLLQALQPQPPGPLAKRSNNADGAHPSDPPGHRSASHDITEQLSTKQKKNGHSVFGELSVNSKSVRDRHCAWNTGSKNKRKSYQGRVAGYGGMLHKTMLMGILRQNGHRFEGADSTRDAWGVSMGLPGYIFVPICSAILFCATVCTTQKQTNPLRCVPIPFVVQLCATVRKAPKQQNPLLATANYTTFYRHNSIQ